MLDARRYDHVLGAAHHRLGGKVDRLLGASALAVDRNGRNAVGKLRGHHHVPADVKALLADLLDAADDHVVDGRAVDAGSLDQRIEDGGAEIGRVPVLQRSFALATGGPYGVDDIGFQAASPDLSGASNLLIDRGKKVLDGAVEFGHPDWRGATRPITQSWAFGMSAANSSERAGGVIES